MIGGRRCDSCAVLFGEAEGDFDLESGANQCEFCDIPMPTLITPDRAKLVPSTAGRAPSEGSSDQAASDGITTIDLTAVDDGPATDDGSLLCAEKDCNCEAAGVAAVSAEAINEPEVTETTSETIDEVTGTTSETTDEVTGTTSEDEDEAQAVDEVRPDAATVDEVRPDAATPEGAGKIDRALKDAALNYLEEATSTILYSL